MRTEREQRVGVGHVEPIGLGGAEQGPNQGRLPVGEDALTPGRAGRL